MYLSFAFVIANYFVNAERFPQRPVPDLHSLDAGGVEHAANLAAHGGGREVLLELGPHHAARPVSARHLAPAGAEHGALLLGLRLVHAAELLAEVKVSRRLVVHVLELDQRGVVGLVGTSTVDEGRERRWRVSDVFIESGAGRREIWQ